MESVRVSPKFQVVIPQRIRESLKLKPGERVQVFLYEGRIEFIPIRSLRKMRGFVRGIDTSVGREDDRT